MSRRRRDLLAAAATGVAALVAGCSDTGSKVTPPPDRGGGGTVTPEPQPDLDLGAFDRSVRNESVVMEVNATNSGNAPGTGTVVFELTVDGETITKERTVELEPNESTTVSMEFDASVDPNNDSWGVTAGLKADRITTSDAG